MARLRPPRWNDSVPGECMDAKCFSGASSVRRSCRGSAERCFTTRGASRCWRSSRRRSPRTRRAPRRFSRAADHAGGAVRAERRQRHHGAPRRRAHGQALGQQIVVENRPGAGGNIGSSARPRAARPTATRCCSAFTGTIGINPSLYANLGYDPAKDLTPIGSIATSPAVLVVHPSLPVKTLKELIAYAKANPGQLSYASSGVGTVGPCRDRDAGGRRRHQGGAGSVPGHGSGDHRPARRARQDDDAADPRHDRLRQRRHAARHRRHQQGALAACCPKCPPSRKRACPASCRSSATASLAPAGTPRPIIERLNAELRNALADETIRKRIVDDGATPRPDSPEDYAAAIDQDRTLWGGIVRKLGLRVE